MLKKEVEVEVGVVWRKAHGMWISLLLLASQDGGFRLGMHRLQIRQVI